MCMSSIRASYDWHFHTKHAVGSHSQFIYLFIYLVKKGEAQLYQENKLCTEVKIDCTLKCKYRFGSTKEHQLGFLFPLQYSLSDFSLLSKRVVYRLQAS